MNPEAAALLEALRAYLERTAAAVRLQVDAGLEPGRRDYLHGQLLGYTDAHDRLAELIADIVTVEVAVQP